MSAVRERLVVLGHRGMLGHLATTFFRESGRDVRVIERRYDPVAPAPFFEELRHAGAEVVINALGLIKQKSSTLADLVALNGAFPLLLRDALGASAKLVHPSTDCVFDGTRGDYGADEAPNATDGYGVSKALGEHVVQMPRTLVVRTSIIGPECASRTAGLLQWLLSQPPGASVPGFLNHRWNGVTTLEWCRAINEVLLDWDARVGASRLVHMGTRVVHTKAALLQAIARAFRKNVSIVGTDDGPMIDRSLRVTVERAPIEDQLAELAAWVEGHGQR